MADKLLEIKNVSKQFGGIKAVQGVSFSVEKGSIVSMIGPNGAGKSTFINLVSGIYAPDSGTIHFEEKDIAGRPAHVIAASGVGRTFQLEELFGSLTVLENVMVGCHTRSKSGLMRCGLAWRSARKEEAWIRESALRCLKEIGLHERANDPITKLPLGERKLVGVARTLALQPRLIMLDEPAGGLAAHEVDRLVNLIRLLVQRGITVFVVEHNMPFVMSLSEKVVVLDQGIKIAEGTPEEVQSKEEVITAYLGEEVY